MIYTADDIPDIRKQKTLSGKLFGAASPIDLVSLQFDNNKRAEIMFKTRLCAVGCNE